MEDDQELPAYTPRASSSQTSHSTVSRGSEYTISREDHKGHKWLSLSVKSRAPKSDLLPIFYGGDLVSGSVALDIVNSESFKSITVKASYHLFCVTSLSLKAVQVTAGITLVGREEQQFLVIEKELWSPATALPDGSTVSKLEKGHYEWPFEFTLPKEVEVLDQKEKKMYPLPPSFMGRASFACINYKITVFVRRSALGVNQSCVFLDLFRIHHSMVCSLFTCFSYVPMTKPGLPSPAVQMAYAENIPPVGPEGEQNL
jgi:hypothetical protein